MWSNLYFYLYLSPHTGADGPAPRESTEVAIADALRLWRGRGEPELACWIDIEAVLTDSNGNYGSDALSDLVNQVVVVGSKAAPLVLLLPLLEDLAARLGWPLYLEEDDDGNEDIVLFDPRPGVGRIM